MEKTETVYIVSQYDTEERTRIVCDVFATRALAEDYIYLQKEFDLEEDFEFFEYSIHEKILIGDK